MSVGHLLGSTHSPQMPGLRGQVRALDTDAIRACIPHRDPFLFVRCAEILGADTIHGVAQWPAAHPIIAGHFPSLGIVPGVCQIEALAQLAGVLIAETSSTPGDAVGVLGAVRKAFFKAPLWPAEDLQMACTLRTLGQAGYLVTAEGRSVDRLILSAEFVLALRPRDLLASLS